MSAAVPKARKAGAQRSAAERPCPRCFGVPCTCGYRGGAAEATVATDEQKFKDKFRGVKTHTLAKALNKLTRGLDWGGSSKASMAQSFARRHDPGFVSAPWKGVTLAKIAAQLKLIEADQAKSAQSAKVLRW